MKRVLVLGLLLAPSLASAHIHLTFPTSRTSQPLGEQKQEHCGLATYSRAAHPELTSTFAPGQTITVTWDETINHPGWFRIAFQPSGDIFGIPPAVGAGGFPTQPQPGLDPANGSIVLVDRIADGKVSQEITFPNMECSNCTLQLIQVMTDKPPYTTDVNSDDIYFNCADIVLKSAGGSPDAGVPPAPDAGATPDAPAAGASGNGGGCAAGAGTPGLGVALGLGLALAATGRRRRAARP